MAYKSTIDSIIKIQKRALRIISNVDCREHTNVLLCKLKLLKFTDLIDLKVAVIMFKANMRLLPMRLLPMRLSVKLKKCFCLKKQR